MRSFLEPLFKKVVDAVTIETVEDWGACLTDISVCNEYQHIEHIPIDVCMLSQF